MAKLRTALRVSTQDLTEIDRRAQQHRMTRTEYMVRCAIGTLDADDQIVVNELEQIKQRVSRLEETAFGQY